MKPWSFRKKFVLGLIFVLLGMFIYSTFQAYMGKDEVRLTKNEILHLEINNVILNGKKFLASLKKHANEGSVKGIVIDVNSPGGAVGASQELFYEIKRIKEETKKPVVCVSTGIMASGAYYASLACDKIVVAPGAIVGSIGVIIEFANLEKLYDWAKIQRFSINTGKYKDSGSEYRSMRSDEKQLFQDMLNEVYEQFVQTVSESRGLSVSEVKAIADGRVMTGAKAVQLKLADLQGTFEDAVNEVAGMANLGKDFKLYKPRKDKTNWFDYIISEEEEDDLNSMAKLTSFSKDSIIKEAVQVLMKTKYINQPMYLMPGFWE